MDEKLKGVEYLGENPLRSCTGRVCFVLLKDDVFRIFCCVVFTVTFGIFLIVAFLALRCFSMISPAF